MEPISTKNNMIALYPGAYKPPHRGHFEVAKALLSGGFKGKVYDVDDYIAVGNKVLQGESDKLEDIDKVIIFIGGQERNGINAELSKNVWEIYKKYLPNIEIVVGDKNPMMEAKNYAKAHPSEKFYAVTGIRETDDLVDLRRVTTFKNRENVDGLVITSPHTQTIRATNFRSSILSGNLDRIREFFPEELSSEEILKILNMLKASIVAEDLNKKIESTILNLFEEKEVKENNGGAPIAPRSVLKSKDRAHLITLYKRIKNQIGSDNVEVSFHNDHVKVSLKDEYNSHNFDYTPFMGSILEYMLDQKMNITPLPEIKIKRDLKEASNFFGRTAYYNPEIKEVVLYTEGRHPKDVMRSFVHEMIHHIQNLEGRLKSYGTTNTNEDEELVEIEKEAYMLGNITFRNWEDKIKNEGYE